MNSSDLHSHTEPSNNIGRWSAQQYQLFIQLFQQYGKDWKLIAAKLKTRSQEQVRSHAQKFFAKKFRIQKEQQEAKQAVEMLGDLVDKRLTRKKVKRVNYRQKEVCLEAETLEEKKKVEKKDKIERKIVREEKKEGVHIGLQTDLVPEQTNMTMIPSLPLLPNLVSPWIFPNPLWIS